MPLSVRTAYAERVASGAAAADPAQAAALDALSRLEGDLNALAEPAFSLPFLRAPPRPPRRPGRPPPATPACCASTSCR